MTYLSLYKSLTLASSLRLQPKITVWKNQRSERMCCVTSKRLRLSFVTAARPKPLSQPWPHVVLPKLKGGMLYEVTSTFGPRIIQTPLCNVLNVQIGMTFKFAIQLTF